jgi:polyhydroxyalkanoate synthesis regulator phasin
MSMLRKWWVAAAAAVAIAAAIGVGASVMAQTPVPGTDTGKSMVDRIAEKLGISSQELSEAIESSAYDAIDERVTAGDLTDEQAQRLKDRIAELPDGALIGPGRRGFGPGGRGPGAVHRIFGGGALAEFLGITADQLRRELQAEGATLASVAAAHGKSREDLKAFMLGQIEGKLDERVAEGSLTQEEADAVLADKGEMLDAIVDKELPAFPGGRRHFRGAMRQRLFDKSDVPANAPTATGSAQN